MKTLQKPFFILILTILLSACTLDIASERPQGIQYIEKNDKKWQQHLQKIKQIKQYQAQGQLGYINNKQRFSTRFTWQYNNPQFYSLLLSSAFSSSILKFEVSPFGITVSDHKGNQRSTKDINNLLHEMIGISIPLQQIGNWLKGQPDENSDYQVGINHLLASFTYSVEGEVWSADYLNYRTDQSIPLPKDILLKSSEQTLKVRIDNWKY